MARSRDGLIGLFVIFLILLIVLVGAYLFIRVNDLGSDPGTLRQTLTYVSLPSQTIEVPSVAENALAENRMLKSRIASLEREQASLRNSLEISRLESDRLRRGNDRFRFSFDCDDDCEDEIEDLEEEIDDLEEEIDDLEEEIDDLEDTIDELCEELDDEGIDSDEC